jgi:hypothetical protein
MSELKYAKLEAEMTLGIKALDQQPKHLDPESFQAAMIAANLCTMEEVTHSENMVKSWKMHRCAKR